MSGVNLECPGRDLLAAYVAGRTPGEQSANLEVHLEQCDTCCAVIAELSTTDDSLLREMKASDQQFADEPELGAILAELRSGPANLEDLSAERRPPRELGAYQLLERIGGGGMGEVYRAQHVHLRRYVAVKVLSPHRLRDAHAFARFQGEMAAVGQLNHAHIVQAFDAGVANGFQFLTMEYVDGLDLAKLISRLGRLRLADAAAIVCQAALGLEHAHRRGVIHRDVKPSNLMITDAGFVKILDLGLALFVKETADRAPDFAGSRQYMSPEQAAGAAVSERTDVYSLSITFLTLLLGQPPHMTFHMDDAQRKNQLRGVLPELPANVNALLVSALAPDARSRTTTMKDLAEVLASQTDQANLVRLVGRARGPYADAEAQFDDVTKTISPAPPGWKRRYTASWAMGGILALAAIVGLAATLMRDREEPTVTTSALANSIVSGEALGLHPWGQYDRETDSFEVHGQSPTIAPLSEIKTPNFVLEAEVSLVTEGQHAGYIFGLHRDKKREWAMPAYYFTAHRHLTDRSTLLIDVRELTRVDGTPIDNNISTAQVFNLDWNRPHRLGIAVDPQGQVQLELDGKIVPRSDWIGKNETLPANWWQGAVGVYVHNADAPAIFRGVRLKPR